MTTKSPPPARSLIHVKSASTSVPPPIRPRPNVVVRRHIVAAASQEVVELRARRGEEGRNEQSTDYRYRSHTFHRGSPSVASVPTNSVNNVFPLYSISW